MSTRCEAAAMDAAVYGSWEDAVPPCDELGDVPVPAGDATYLLCRGCADAVQVLGGLGMRAQMALAVRRAERLERARVVTVRLVHALASVAMAALAAALAALALAR